MVGVGWRLALVILVICGSFLPKYHNIMSFIDLKLKRKLTVRSVVLKLIL